MLNQMLRALSEELVDDEVVQSKYSRKLQHLGCLHSQAKSLESLREDELVPVERRVDIKGADVAKQIDNLISREREMLMSCRARNGKYLPPEEIEALITRQVAKYQEISDSRITLVSVVIHPFFLLLI